ncbi:tryptophan--tRNA ligase [candidate division WOR-3 bacterium]|nr:tryptophan--tRNA ligase [candidate division WOR-3 bacterium]
MKKKILSGNRATGKIHIGNLFGVLTNWVKLQSKYECFYEIADLHVLTTNYNHNEHMRSNIKEMAIDWMACGISPEKSTIFIQSLVPEHAELYLFFSMLVPLGWLERNPTLKEQIRDLNLQDKVNYGLLGYPVLQAADILAYKADAVPVGEDQLSHIEITREIARRFNSVYKSIFPEPKALLTDSPKVPGLDGRKMSKSLDNAILVDELPEITKEKVKKAFTDPLKIHKNDKGHPDGCVVFAYYKLVNVEKIEEVRKLCTQGKIGCVNCKEELANLLNKLLVPYREAYSKVNQEDIDEILEEGSRKARKVAKETLCEVKEVMNLW